MKLMRSLTWLVMLALAIGFVACSDDDDPAGPSTTDYFDEMFDLGDAYYTSGTKNITAADVYAELQESGNDLFLVDYRSTDHFQNLGHIDGAVNWAIGDLMDNVSQIPSGAKVINICYTGQTASQATAVLRILGYDAWNLKFGMCGWTSDTDVNRGLWENLEAGGQQLVTDPSTLTGTYDYPARESEAADATEAFMMYADEYLTAGTKNISSADLYANLNDGDTSNDPVILNYWPQTMYDAGHIPGAVQANPITMDLLAGVDPDKQVVVYCHTGQTSSQLVPWLNALGYDAYSMLFGVNSIDQTFEGLVTYHAPDQDYPVVTGP